MTSVPGGAMSKINKVERLSYSGGLLGLIFASSRGKLDAKVKEMNEDGWNVHFIHPDQPNLLIWLLRFLILIFTLGLWTIGNSELLVFEKENIGQ